MINRPEPTGAFHEVGPEEMFFSTTDARGVIKEANSVFVRLSRHDRAALVGAPHNIIRHPWMPGGAFLLMWKTLEAGQPFCAYVDNLAADGSRYTVFATITPVGEDYLSVRVRPQRTDLLEAARGLYRASRPEELAARERGSSAHDAAELGLGLLGEGLRDVGLASYDEFMWAALPAEIRERAASRGGYPVRPGAQGAWADLLRAGGRLHAGLAAWFDELDRLADLADALVAGSEHIHRAIEGWRSSADEFGAIVQAHDGFVPVLGTLTLWATMAGEIDDQLAGIAERLATLRTSAAQTRFRISLGALQSEMVGKFASEVIDGVPGSENARPAIRLLVRALRDEVIEAAVAMRANAALASEVADEIQALADLIGVPTTLLGSFESMAASSPHAEVQALLPRVRTVMSAGEADAASLSALAGRCRSIAPLDTAALREALDEIEGLAAESHGMGH